MKLLTSIGLALVLCSVLTFVKARVEKRLKAPLTQRLTLAPLQASYYGKSLKRYGLGFQNVLSDLLWIETLQRASHATLKSDQVSWEYAQLDAIATLDPKFVRVYEFGAAFLSVFRQDKLGAKLLLLKWAERFPTSWKSHYTLGFHLFSEMGEYEPAARHLLQAAELPGAPPWLSSLGVRLLSEAGANRYAMERALFLYPGLQNAEGKVRMHHRIRALNYHLQKTAWEQALNGFRNAGKGEPSLRSDLLPYLPSDIRTLASVSVPGDLPEELKALLNEDFKFHYNEASRSIQSLSPDSARLETTGIFRPKSQGK